MKEKCRVRGHSETVRREGRCLHWHGEMVGTAKGMCNWPKKQVSEGKSKKHLKANFFSHNLKTILLQKDTIKKSWVRVRGQPLILDSGDSPHWGLIGRLWVGWLARPDLESQDGAEEASFCKPQVNMAFPLRNFEFTSSTGRTGTEIVLRDLKQLHEPVVIKRGVFYKNLRYWWGWEESFFQKTPRW